jgi:hypothetical protein
VAICLFDAIVALNVSKVKKNEYFCIFLSLPSFYRCFAEFYETLFSGPRRVFPRDEFYNIAMDAILMLQCTNMHVFIHFAANLSFCMFF